MAITETRSTFDAKWLMNRYNKLELATRIARTDEKIWGLIEWAKENDPDGELSEELHELIYTLRY